MIALLLAWSLLQEEVKDDRQCMECHVKQTDEWKRSVHAKHETSCISCHQKSVIDRSKLPANPHLKEKPFIAGTKNLSQNLCVQCHDGVTEEFKKGPHWDEDVDPRAKWTAKKRQGCLSCHEPHGTALADRKAIYADRCKHCHYRENAVQQKVMTSYMAAADPFDEELKALKRLLEHPLPGVPYGKAETVRNTAEELHRSLRRLQHNCEFKELEKKIPPVTPEVKAAAAEMQQQYDAAGKRRRNYCFGFLGLMAVNLVVLRAWCIKKYSGGKH